MSQILLNDGRVIEVTPQQAGRVGEIMILTPLGEDRTVKVNGQTFKLSQMETREDRAEREKKQQNTKKKIDF